MDSCEGDFAEIQVTYVYSGFTLKTNIAIDFQQGLHDLNVIIGLKYGNNTSDSLKTDVASGL